MKNIARFALALLVCFALTEAAFAQENHLITKAGGTTYTASPTNGYQASYLSGIIQSAATDSIQYELFAQLDFRLKDFDRRGFVLIDAYCDVANPNVATYKMAAEQNFSDITRTVNILKRRCLAREG